MFKKLLPMFLFNVLIGLLFIFSNIYLWGIFNSEVSYFTPTQVGINQVSINPLQVTISHLYLSNGNINLGPLPTQVPNYPFILFWVALVGNICFVVLTLRTVEKKQAKSNMT